MPNKYILIHSSILASCRRMTGEIATLKEQLEMKKLEKHKLAEELK